MPPLNQEDLNRTLESVQARWRAQDAKGEFGLGYVPGPEDHSLPARELVARANHAAFMASATFAAPSYPREIDWRQYAGPAALLPGNYVTSIKSQGNCGSCVAFATLSAFESAVRIRNNNPAVAIDLSEADLFYCNAEALQGRRCAGPNSGWWPDAALDVCQATGVVEEACFPYSPGDQACNRCAEPTFSNIAAWQEITAPSDMKDWLANRGPLITCFTVYDDFYKYQSGVYHHVSGAYSGGHCVSCVGYDDDQRYWICKNSWDIAWGEGGFFRIAYGQVGIDAAMWALQL